MLDFAIDLINQAASNPFVVFCFCNVIIAVILSGSKPGSSFHRGSLESLPAGKAMYRGANERRRFNNSEAKAELSADRTGTRTRDESAYDAEKRNRKKGDGCEMADGSEGDDELKRRAEEFIAKVNKELKEERLRDLQLVL